MKKSHKIAYYILLVLISALFLMASIPKLMANPQAVQGFEVAHLPIWFMYFIGVCEVLGVIGLWIKKTAIWAAGGLLIILIGAVVTTAMFVSVSEALLPLVAGIVLVIVAWLGRKRNMKAMPVPPTPTA